MQLRGRGLLHGHERAVKALQRTWWACGRRGADRLIDGGLMYARVLVIAASSLMALGAGLGTASASASTEGAEGAERTPFQAACANTGGSPSAQGVKLSLDLTCNQLGTQVEATLEDTAHDGNCAHARFEGPNAPDETFTVCGPGETTDISFTEHTDEVRGELWTS